MTPEIISLILRIIATIYFMYFVQDIAVSLRIIAKKKERANQPEQDNPITRP